MKTYDITGENIRIIENKSKFIHRCRDCSRFEICERTENVSRNSIACEKFN